MYVTFRFGAKMNHFRSSQPSCSSKNLDCISLCSTYDKSFEKTFLMLCFLLGHAFGQSPGTT